MSQLKLGEQPTEKPLGKCDVVECDAPAVGRAKWLPDNTVHKFCKEHLESRQTSEHWEILDEFWGN